MDRDVATKLLHDGALLSPAQLVQYDDEGNIPGVVLHRKDTLAGIGAVVLKDGEIAVTANGEGLPTGLRAGDGVTAGGVAVGGATAVVSSSLFPTAAPTTLTTTTLVKLANTRLAIAAGEVWNVSVNFLTYALASATGGPGFGWELRALTASDAAMGDTSIMLSGVATFFAGFPASFTAIAGGTHSPAMHAGVTSADSVTSGYMAHFVTLSGIVRAGASAGFLYPMARLNAIKGTNIGAYATITGVKISG